MDSLVGTKFRWSVGSLDIRSGTDALWYKAIRSEASYLYLTDAVSANKTKGHLTADHTFGNASL